MIIGKKDKSKIIELQDEIKNLNTKIAIMKSEHEKKEDDLLNLLKAFLNKIAREEMVITVRDLANVKDYCLIETNDYMSLAKRYQIVKDDQIYSNK